MYEGIEQGQVVNLYVFVLLAGVMRFSCQYYSWQRVRIPFLLHPGLSSFS